MPQRAQKAIFADPKLDLSFKKVFGTREHRNLLIELLNALRRLSEEARILDMEYLSGEQLPAFDGLKLSLLDVKCTDARGVRYVVEMQVFPVEGFEKRVVLNASNAYVEQLESGENYAQLSDVVAVTICNFALFGKQVPMLSRWLMREEESQAVGLSQSTTRSGDRERWWRSGRTSSARRRSSGRCPQSCRRAPSLRRWRWCGG